MRLFLFLNLFIFVLGCTTVEITKGVIKVTDTVKNRVEETFPKEEKTEIIEEDIKKQKQIIEDEQKKQKTIMKHSKNLQK